MSFFVLRALLITYKTEARWVRKKKEIGRREDGNFRRSRFRPFRGGFMSLAVANDFAFPNEDIRRGSIRKTTFNLAKTGDQRSDPSGAMRRARRKNIDDRFPWCWPKFHFGLSASLTQHWQTFDDFDRFSLSSPFPSSPSLTVVVASLIRVLIWLPIKPNIRQTVISEFSDDAIMLTFFIARCHKTLDVLEIGNS